MKEIRVVITGGHAGATAYAVIQEIKSQNKNWQIYWIGPETPLEGKKIETIEQKVFPKMGVKVFSLRSGRIQRKFTVWSILSILKIPLGFIHAFSIISKVKPDIVLSFGGYSSYPVVVASWFNRIPVVTHEQTAVAGRANIFSSYFSDKIAISRNSSEKFFPKNKTVLTGNPVETNILNIKPKVKISNPPLVFVTAGHSGSVTINDVVEESLTSLLSEFKVVHQTGDFQFVKLINLRNSLTRNQKNNYSVYGTISPADWPSFMTDCDIIVSRSGANIVSQIMAVKRPAILIPIPFAYKNEQMENARLAEEFGIVEILEQKNLNKESLLKLLAKIRKTWSKMVFGVRDKKSPDILAAKNIVNLIQTFIK
jgi:UDP-N-acetylglucosamine--N-acetylmuramyl-(pentapeptide) pyrophosphoryl-undecaprenol N-acetylglucosamine transferase